MHVKVLIFTTLVAACLAAEDEPCYGDGAEGVCVSTSDCSASGGTTIDGACPADAADIKCWSKPTCSAGACMWESDCPGSTVSGECPGPNEFMCCDSTIPDYGGYDDSDVIPDVGCCQSVSVDGAQIIVDAWPGRVREIGCCRDCDSGDSSEHCEGKAIDLMISDAGGTPTLGGNEIAEWVKDHADELNLYYVIWGQRIWDADRSDDASRDTWSTWRTLGDRGDVTSNHWDHVHVSFH